MVTSRIVHSAPRRSYTLIELLIVVALLGLAGTLVIPHMVGADSMKVQSAVRQLIGDLSFAQSDALAHQEFRRVHFYADGRGYCIVRVDDTNYAAAFNAGSADYISDPLASAGELGRYIVDFNVDDRFELVNIDDVDLDGGGRDIVYDPLGGTIMSGGVPGTGGTIDIVSGDEAYRITVAPFTGKLSVSEL
ncbi:MAG: pilus assembly FimT family protein [Planctomycetota bacterium]|jgi:type II secretory pathway pseudopilin PulG